ncbi:TonB-dependent receptor [Paraburkholderia sp. SEWSISQ10-3 4]|uniref:TonB-dependent siderophore receptor n=1 Tax=Paraburkholderia TaxID=1822464 RepID=UPI00224E4271|nr:MULTISPECIES: TonB-dependent receptor [Paraburkholderia]MCX4141542.1 TonB-dependent receptor [Paraburkholderia aspalathi]MDN7174222.1 TonB-dependent receptor [Paraburkholderia sp. SEWSISQ10-3 4]MDQ6503863.1 TonB-dependent receptor [Paraburkholderia aspalathi]
MAQHRKTGAGNGSRSSRGALRARQPAHFARHIATAALISAGLPFNVALAADAPSASAASPRKSYDIPAGPLEAALNRFGRESGLLLSFPAVLTDGRMSEGLRGDYDIQQGFGRILRGTGLGAVQQSNGSYTLEQRTEPSADIGNGNGTTLPAVTVSSSTVKAGSYRPPADAVVTRSDTPVLDTAQAVNIVPAQVLHDQRPRNLDDALANVSGIVQGNTLAGTQDTLLKRGFGGNRDGSIMHNGMPLVQGRALNAAADSVEVLKGPTSLLYGIMDPGGVVNVVSKQPLLKPYHAISVLGSTYGHGRNGAGATFDTTGPIGDSGLAYRLVVDQTDEQYWRNFGEHRETLVAPSLAWYGRDTQVVVSYEYRKFLYPFDRGTALDPKTNKPLAISSRERLDEPFNEMDGESNLAQISVDHQINANWKAHFGYSYNRETYDAGQLRVQGINSTTGAVSRSNDATHGALSTDSYAIAYVDGHFDIAGLRNDLQVGIDDEYRRIYRKDLLRQATKYPFNYFRPVYGLESPSTTVSASDSDQTDTLHDRSLFLQDSLHLTDKWILIGGARFLSYNQIAGKGRPFVVNTDINGTKWLPRAGVVYKWTDTVSLYGSYTQSLKPTSTIAPLSSGVVIDSSVLPEEATSWELGAKVAMPNGLSGALALFNIDKKNVLVQQYNDTTKQTDWRTAGKARSRGVELDVAGQIGQHWSVIASYAYIDAKTTEDPLYAGKRLWNAPQNTASLAAVYDFGTIFGGDQLRVGAGAHYVGPRPGDSANSFTLPAYTVADAFATYETKLGNRHLSFQLNVKNLFNKTYYPSSVNKYFVSVGDARQVSLLSTLEF